MPQTPINPKGIAMSTMRKTLIVTILLALFSVAAFVYIVPYSLVVPAALVIRRLYKKGADYSAYGTARWAQATDIPHLLEGNGLIVGHIAGKPSRIEGLKALFNSRLPDRDACERFLLPEKRAGKPRQADDRGAYGCVRADRRWKRCIVYTNVFANLPRIVRGDRPEG